MNTTMNAAQYTKLKAFGATGVDANLTIKQIRALAIQMGIVKHDDMFGVGAVCEGYQLEKMRIMGA